MTMIDANVLIYAYAADMPQQKVAAEWLRRLLESDEKVGIPWVSLWAFLRVSTNSRISEHPQTPEEAFEIIDSWLAQPRVVALTAGPRHSEILRSIVRQYSIMGSAISDAVLVALAIENGAILASTDKDFRKFAELRWINPLEAKV